MNDPPMPTRQVSTKFIVFQTLEAAEAEGQSLYHVFDPVTKSDTIWPEKVIIAGLPCSTQHKFPLVQDHLSYLPWLPVVAHDWSDHSLVDTTSFS